MANKTAVYEQSSSLPSQNRPPHQYTNCHANLANGLWFDSWLYDSRKAFEKVSYEAVKQKPPTNDSRSAKYRRESLIGVGICASSLILMVIRWINGIKGFEIYYSLPWTVGGGILLSAQFVALAVRCPDQMANATAIFCLVQQVGQIVGTSASTAALQQLFGSRLGVNLSDALPEKTQVCIRTNVVEIMRCTDRTFRSSKSFSKITTLLQLCLKFCKEPSNLATLRRSV